MYSGGRIGVKKKKDEEVKRLHSDALVIDTLYTNSIKCLPGESEASFVDESIQEGVNITDIARISEQIGDLCDKL
jgi:hypothetical protein